ncbi:MAG: amidohydrolase family protein [Cytophagaceae bacterium]|nr:amidohydrolase family protein [Cytophagaceae bacterium]
MKIDAHQHFWLFDAVRDTWITETMTALRRDFSPDDLQPVLEQHGFDGCVAVQADQTEQETDYLLGLAAQHEFIKGVVGWVDFRASNLRERLDQYQQLPKLKGFRHVVQAEPDELFMLRTEFLNGIRTLGEYKFTYDILIYPNHLGVAREFVSRFPNQKFVLDHLAKPYIKQGVIDKWKPDIQALARHENVFCKVSGLLTEADLEAWQPADFRPYLDAVVEAFGTDRLMFGSDWPVCLLAGQYEDIVGLIEDYFTAFSESEKAKIWGDNAVKFYNLKSPPTPKGGLLTAIKK